jgi:LAO/AO transport system kinase
MGLAGDIISRDPRAASRLISWIEDNDVRAVPELKKLCRGGGGSYLIGITGPPGAGKSTLADRLIAHYRTSGLRVGVLAFDPSSPFSGGAVLGDRIRMQGHATDEGVFIRSMANRGWPGGLGRAAAEAVRVLDAFGCGMIIIETVGVGQSEVEVSRLAYTTVLVLTPGAGDKIQALKAGVIETASMVVLNKADLPDAEHTARALEMILGMQAPGPWRVPLLKAVARDGSGVADVAETVARHRRYMEQHGILEKRKRAAVKSHLMDLIYSRFHEVLSSRLPDKRACDALVSRIVDGSTDPYSLAEEIVRKLSP